MKMMATAIAKNLAEVSERIASACQRAGRDHGAVRLIAVSKTKPIELIEEAVRAGQRSFGENYVQEALQKVAAQPSLDWHFIGSLQTNKVKQVIGRFSLIHSVDRIKLATELGKAARQMGVVQDVLMQVHVGDEATKSGVDFDEAPALIEEILREPHLRLRGIMSLPPLTEDERQGRKGFAELRMGFEKWRRECLSSQQAACFTELSMGTSSDFEWAILEGATMVRVGTSIFGARS